MPENSKKSNQKKNVPKEQRRPRQARNQNNQSVAGKKIEAPVQAEVSENPPVQEPGPEFYKSLKRETDEILKITEEANAKYSKKEITSNWKKYEIPIETYEEIEEQENIGADYEKLIQNPASAGGHFQFKHEKSWDSSTAATEYDKYFNICIDNLSVALNSLPFYERNNLDFTIFTETDISNMKNRSTRYKQKYYNDKSYTTPELEIADKILNIVREQQDTDEINTPKDLMPTTEITENIETELNILNRTHSTDVETLAELKEESKDITNIEVIETLVTKQNSSPSKTETKLDDNETLLHLHSEDNAVKNNNAQTVTADVPEVKNLVIETPEDLEKWLDDFLDN